MVTIRILEHRPVLSALLARSLPARLRPAAADLPPDLLVVSPDWRSDPLPALSCRILLIPGRLAERAGAISARWTVSYGGSPRDSLTFSSALENTLLLSLQREIVTLAGFRLERQEFPLFYSGQGSPLFPVACAGVQLLLNRPPSRIRIPEEGERP